MTDSTGIVYCPLKKDTTKEGRVFYPNGMPILKRQCLAYQARGDCDGVVCEYREKNGDNSPNQG